ncbi:MAG: hypothetical protein ACI9VR_003007 [Cognaticolwellia sp.]|jgi:hypothetical protein
MKRTHRGTVFVLCALSYVEIASVLRPWAREGSTTFGYYIEAMLFLGPWNGLVSPHGISSSSQLVPLLSISWPQRSSP